MTIEQGIRIPEVERGELCWFLGILIEMHPNKYLEPNFQATYEDLEPMPRAVYAIDTLEILEGELPHRAHVFVLEWAHEHRNELRENATRIKDGKPIQPILPLE
jgi:hypothetical protein